MTNTPFETVVPGARWRSLAGISCLFLALVPAAAAQFGPQEIISVQANGAQCVYSTDLDGDGDADVLAACGDIDTVAWYENLGGGSFGPQQVITTQAISVRGVHAADLDGDNDADVLSASNFDDKIAWYENLGGGAFGPQQVITTLANGAQSVQAEDLDGDGDADVVSASRHDRKIAWHENLGSGSFGPQQIISTQVDFAEDVYAIDLDGDSDADVLSAAWYGNEIAWFENLGNGSFGQQQVITNLAEGAEGVFATDLDGDGDADVLSASQFDFKIAWYENQLGSIGTTYCQPAVPNSTGQPAAISAFGSALTADNDLTLHAYQLPMNQFGYFLNSLAQGLVQNPGGSQGNLCLGGAIGRYNPAAGYPVQNSGTSGSIDVPLDLASTPTPAGFTAVVAGQTWNFTAWYRDFNPGTTSNFTDAVSITFL